MRYEVVIDRLILRGISVHSRRQLLSALQHELATRLQAEGVHRSWSRSAATPTVHAKPLTLAAGPGRDAVLGRRIAVQVHRSLTAAHTPPASKKG